MEQFLSIKEYSNLTGIPVRTLKDRCKKGKYETVKVFGNGGLSYKIKYTDNTDISALPAKAFNIIPVEKKFEYDKEIVNLLKSFGIWSGIDRTNDLIFSEELKQSALLKVDLITEYWSFTEDAKGRMAEATATFLEGYNSGLLLPGIFNKLGKVSTRSLYRWAKTYKDSGLDYYSLINDYNYASNSSISTTLTNQEKYLLLKYMLHQNRFSLGRAYELFKFELEKQGVEKVSSYAAFNRVWKYLKQNYADRISYARGGKKFVSDTQLPYIVRDWSKVPAGEMLVGDGHTLDFMIKDPFTGKPVRATMVGFVDCTTRDLCGYEIMLTENTQCIASALRNAIKYLGKVPKCVQLDNGRAFKGKFFNNSDIENSGLNGVYARLGIKTYYSRAYNGRAKVIERFFREFTESMAKLISSYCGGSIETKPAYMMRNEKDHIKLRNLNGADCPTIEEVKTYIDFWLENIYRKRFTSYNRNLQIGEAINAAKGSGVPEEILDDMLCGYDRRKCGRNGVTIFGQQYFNEKLLGLDKDVIIKYSLVDLNQVYIYTIKGEKICTAERVRAVCAQAEIFGTPEDVAEYKRQMKIIKQMEKTRLKGVKEQLNYLYKQGGGVNKKTAEKVEQISAPAQKQITQKYRISDKLLEMIPDCEEEQGKNKYKCINYYE